MGHGVTRRSRGIATALLVMVSATALAGCEQKTAGLGGTDPLTTASTDKGSFKRTAALGAAYQKDPGNAAKAIAYANGLEGIGQGDKALQVLKQLYDSSNRDPQIGSVYGKKLVSSGRGASAIPILEDVAKSPDADWRVYSALGSAYDQEGQFEDARKQYTMALAKNPDEVGVLNNLGMSYMLQGDLKNAETTLRKAQASPKAKSVPRIRQNLALAVGLQGRFDEARRIASEDLPPDQVEANMAYLQKMLSQPNTWQQLSDGSQG